MTATYTGDANFASSTSDDASFAVSPAITTTTMSLSASAVSYGNEQVAKAAVVVTAASGGNPPGPVTIATATTVLCTIRLAAGTGQCALPPSGLAPGIVSLIATYQGTANFTSSGSGITLLAVSPAPTTTTLSISPAVVTYGHEQAAKLGVKVTGDGITATGSVTVLAGRTTVCVITLKSGVGACILPRARFPAGVATLTASYAGGIDEAPSASAIQTLTVSKASTKTALTLSATTVTAGKEQSEHLSVKVTAQYAAPPTGTVTVKVGARSACVIILASGTGTCTLSARELRPGTYDLTGVYPGSASYDGSTSAKETLTVR